ncbi:hypothetical protein vseg_008970 [Gypsophila vaccaria]
MELQSAQQNGPYSPSGPTVTRSDPSNPYPTTFVQADSSSFKQVVQMLTGSPTHPSNSKPGPTPQKSKLYERRNNPLKHLRISPLLPSSSSSSSTGHHSPNRHYPYLKQNNPVLFSPTLLDFPSLLLSPVTPLIHDPFARSPVSSTASPNDINQSIIDKVAEDKAIAEKGFFLHPVSPGSDNPEPRLLPLFPLSSPKS